MMLTVDDAPLDAGEMGLRTVGQVLSHLQRDNRLVVQLLIDGEEPEPGGMGRARQVELAGHAVYIETADPRKLALEVLQEVENQLGDADRYRAEAVELLQKNQSSKALESLGGCLRIWRNAQESITKTAELLRLDLAAIYVGGDMLQAVLAGMSEQLRGIKSALEQRDYVSLCDVLLYDMADTNERWEKTLLAIEQAVRGIR